MKKITLFMLAFSLAIICFGQKPYGKTSANSAFTSKVPMSTNVHDLKSSSPLGKVFWAPTSGSKVSYMTQNFDGTFLPTSWTQTILFTTKTWMQGNPSQNPFSTIDPTNVSSAVCPYSLPGETQNEWLKSPSITGTSAASSLFLKFWAGFSYDYLPAGGLGAPGATLQCKISTNGGTIWTTLWDANNTPLFTGWVWREISLDITSYKANPFMIAWVVTGADGDLMGLDNISISEPPAFDGGVTEIKAPLSSCSNLSASENIIVKIENFGTTTITGFPVAYKLNNSTPVTATFSGSILPGDTALYTFTGANAANLSTSGNYQIIAYTSIAGDADIANDSSTTYIYSGAANLPFAMGFESTDDLTGWSLTDANADSYTWGLFTGASYAHTGTGFAGYLYNSASAADDWLFTKCINLMAGTTYQLKFYYRAMNMIYPEALNVNIGQSIAIAGMTTQLVDLPNITDTVYQSSTTTFTVPSSGTYFIGFHCKSAADMYNLFIDDITVDAATTNPIAYCTPLSWPAGNVPVSTTVTSGTFTLSNIGSGTLTCSGISGLSAPFTTTLVPASVSLAAGTSTTFTFSYNPTIAGTNNQTVVIATNGGNIIIDLSGTGTSCAVPIGTFPWFESFEGTFLPSCWTKVSPDGGTGWDSIAAGTTPLPGFVGGTMTTPSGGGNNAVYCTYTTGGANSNNQWLITPQINVPANALLSFSLYWFGAYQDYVDVKISTSSNNVANFTSTLLSLDTNSLIHDTWKQFVLPISAYFGQNIYIAFNEHVTDNMVDGAFIAIDLVRVDISTNVNQNVDNVEVSLSIYPNPATNMVTLNSTDEITHLKVIDLLGNNVYESDASQNMIQLNTSAYAKGIYFVVVNTEKQNFTRKLQITK